MIGIMMGILFPLFNGAGVFIAAFMCKTENGKCCRSAETPRNVCRRVTVGLVGFFHIFGWHAGYLVAPISLLVMAFLPNQFADKILKKNQTDKNQTEPAEKIEMKGDVDHEVVK